VLRLQKRNIYSGPCTGPSNPVKPCRTPKTLEYEGSSAATHMKSSHSLVMAVTRYYYLDSVRELQRRPWRLGIQVCYRPSVRTSSKCRIYPLFLLLSCHYILGASGFIPLMEYYCIHPAKPNETVTYPRTSEKRDINGPRADGTQNTNSNVTDGSV